MRFLLIGLLLSLSGCSRIEFYRTWNGTQPIPTERERNEYIRQNTTLPQDIKEKILSGKAAQGMTEADVVAIFGKPCGRYETGTGYTRWDYNYNENGFMSSGTCYNESNQSVYFKETKVAFANKKDFQDFLKDEEDREKNEN